MTGRQRFRGNARCRGDRADHPVVTEIVGEVRHFDDEDVPFPMAARHAHDLADVRIERRTSVERDRPIQVVLLVEDDHVAGLLEDLIADDRRRNGRTRHAGGEAQDATVEVLDLSLVRDDVLAPGQRLGRQRDLAVCRIHTHRPRDRSLGQLRTLVEAVGKLAVRAVRRAVRHRHQRRLDAARQRDGNVKAGDVRLTVGGPRRRICAGRARVGRIVRGWRGATPRRRSAASILRAADAGQKQNGKQRTGNGDRSPHG